MRTTFAISVVALAVAAVATPGEAQTFGRSGDRGFSGNQPRSFGGAPGGGFQQRQTSPSPGFQQRSVSPPPPQGNRQFRSVQPPAPGGVAGTPGGARPQLRSVQPPAPGGVAGTPGGARPQLRSVQPPAPGGVAGLPGGGNPQIRSVQPPPPAATRSAQPPIGGGIQPPVAGPSIPTAVTGVTATAATVGVLGATGAVAAPRPGAAATSDTASVGQPIGPSADTTAIPAATSVATTTSAVGTAPVAAPTAAADLPPLEMLASVGTPIMPVAGAAAETGRTAQVQAHGHQARGPVVRHVVTAEGCSVPGHVYRRGYWRW